MWNFVTCFFLPEYGRVHKAFGGLRSRMSLPHCNQFQYNLHCCSPGWAFNTIILCCSTWPDCWILLDWCGVWPKLLHWSGFCWRCLSPCWTARASCSHIGDNCKWGSILRVWGELAEDKGPSFGLQGGYAINHQGSGPGRHGSRGVCLPWLSYPLVNQKHLWHQLPKCHHSCCHAELRKSDLEVTARHLNEVEAVQHVYLTNIPVWFGLMGDI